MIRLSFFDSYGFYNRGQTIQYLIGLSELGYKIKYILDPFSQHKKGDKATLDYVEKNIDIELITFDKELDLYVQLKSIILKCKPSKILFHLSPYSIDALSFWSQVKGIEKIQIVLTDHAYWSGHSMFDKYLCFRDVGAEVCNQIRDIDIAKIFKVPQFPLTDDKYNEESLPIPKFKYAYTGGAIYKFIDKDLTFFNLLKEICRQNSDLKILFGAIGDSGPLERFIKKHQLTNQIILHGNVSNIYEVINHSHIYINSFPLSGGHMVFSALIGGTNVITYSPEEFYFHQPERLPVRPKQNSNHSKSDFIRNFNILWKEEYTKNILKISDIQKEFRSHLKSALLSDKNVSYNPKSDTSYKHNINSEHKRYVEEKFLKSRLLEKLRILRKESFFFIELKDIYEFLPTILKIIKLSTDYKKRFK